MAEAPKVDLEAVLKRMSELEKEGKAPPQEKSKEPLPKAPPELGPPTPRGQEAVGVGYELASRTKRRSARRKAIGKLGRGMA